MKGETKRFTLFLEGNLPPERLELLSSRSPKRTLLILEPRTVPGLGTILSLSHSCERVRWWMYSKLFTETLSEHDKIVFTLLTLRRSDEEWSFFSKVKDFDFTRQSTAVRIALSKKLNELFSFTRGDPTEFWRTFQPSLSINRIWFDRKRIAPVARIGVGYKDKGTLGGPSEEGSPSTGEDKTSLWNDMFLSFSLLCNQPLPTVLESPRIRRSLPRKPPADELHRAKR